MLISERSDRQKIGEEANRSSKYNEPFEDWPTFVFGERSIRLPVTVVVVIVVGVAELEMVLVVDTDVVEEELLLPFGPIGLLFSSKE